MERAGITEGIGTKSFLSIATGAQEVWIFCKVKISGSNPADSKTLLGFLVRLQRGLGIQERTFVFDGGWEKPVELRSAESGEGLPISLELREAKLQERLSRSSQKMGSFGLLTRVKLWGWKPMGFDL